MYTHTKDALSTKRLLLSHPARHVALRKPTIASLCFVYYDHGHLVAHKATLVKGVTTRISHAGPGHTCSASPHAAEFEPGLCQHARELRRQMAVDKAGAACLPDSVEARLAGCVHHKGVPISVADKNPPPST